MTAALLLLLALEPQDKKDRDRMRMLQDPLGPWRVQYFERNARGEHVLVAEVAGDNAIPVDLVKKVVEVNGLRALYYTEPQTPEEKSQKVGLAADRATYDESAGLLRLRGNVRVASEDGSDLECSEIDLYLKQKRFHTRETFRLSSPTLSFTGRGLEADDALHRLVIAENGRMAGRMADPRVREDAEKKPWLEFDSRGPMTVLELDHRKRARITGTAGTRMRTTGGETEGTVRCETATIQVSRLEKEVQFESMALAGDAWVESGPNRIRAQQVALDRLTGRAEFAGDVEAELRPDPNAGPVRIRAHEMVQQSVKNGEAWEPAWIVAVTEARFEGFGADGGEPVRGDCSTFHYDLRERRGYVSPDKRVRIERGRDRIESDDVAFDEKNGTTEFRGAVRADVRLDAEEPPLHLTAPRLVERSETVDGVWRVASIEADGGVRLRIPSREADIECASVAFDVRSQSGVLHGGPWVKLVSGRNTITAARVLLPDRDTMVLQGPKRVRLEDEKGASYTIVSDGDIRISAADGRIKIVDRCRIFSKESRVSADRVDVQLAPDRKSVESVRGAGRVEIRRPVEDVRIWGDRMSVVGETAAVSGRPNAVLTRPGLVATLAEVRFDPKTGRAEGRRGQERIRIRFTEEPQR